MSYKLHVCKVVQPIPRPKPDEVVICDNCNGDCVWLRYGGSWLAVCERCSD